MFPEAFIVLRSSVRTKCERERERERTILTAGLLFRQIPLAILKFNISLSALRVIAIICISHDSSFKGRVLRYMYFDVSLHDRREREREKKKRYEQ